MEADYIIADKILSGKEGIGSQDPTPSLQLLALLGLEENRLRQKNESSRVLIYSADRSSTEQAGREREDDQSDLRSVVPLFFLFGLPRCCEHDWAHVTEEKSPRPKIGVRFVGGQY